MCRYCSGIYAINTGELSIGQYDIAVGSAHVVNVICHGPGQPMEPIVDGPAAGSLYRNRILSLGPVRHLCCCGVFWIGTRVVGRRFHLCLCFCNRRANRHGNSAGRTHERSVPGSEHQYRLSNGKRLFRRINRRTIVRLFFIAKIGSDLHTTGVGRDQLCRSIGITVAISTLIGASLAAIDGILDSGRGPSGTGNLYPPHCNMGRAKSVSRPRSLSRADRLSTHCHNRMERPPLATLKWQRTIQHL